MDQLFDNELQAKILIVDDDAMMRMLMHDALDNGYYEITESESGEDALQRIQAEPPDIVLLDVKMPGMDGFEVCTQIREKYDDNNISIVVVTGLDDSESIEKAFELGATAFINKPINPVTFPYRIQYLLSARSTFISLKQRETHLEYMDRISRILTHNKDLDLILQETLEEMLRVFKADAAIILSSYDSKPEDMDLLCGVLEGKPASNMQQDFHHIIDALPMELYRNARTSEYPIRNTIHTGEASRKQCIIKSLHLQNNETWYILLLRNKIDNFWSPMYQETFYRISFRLNSVLSHHLLLQKLHESEALLRQAQHIGKLGNWSINIKTGELSWSDEIYRIYGYTPGSFTPDLNHLQKIILDEDRERIQQFEESAFFSGVTESIEYRIKLADNQIRWVHKQGIGTFDENGDIIAINGTLQDITERIVKQEQELHEHKMDAVGQLTSGVAHDFGNLMTIAKGNLELLDDSFLEHYQIDEDDREILEDAKSAIVDGANLTKQLLAFSRKKSIAPENINIKHAIESFSHLFKKTLGDTISLNIKVQSDLPDIFVDPSQLESSLLNAVINARDAMPRGGKLTIHAKKHHRLPTALSQKIQQPQTEEYICISIADTGSGMNIKTLKRATEPFFTTKNEGTGLGLSMIYGFMRQSNGILKIESKTNKGTCLLMFFPVSSIANTSYATGRQINNLLPAELPDTKTILVVDDREAVRRFAIRCLKSISCTILQAEDASSAIEVLNKNDTVHLLFSDILMPGEMNGRDLAKWVKKNRPEIKILLTTASERETEKNANSNEVSFQVLPKPYSQHDLLTLVHKIL